MFGTVKFEPPSITMFYPVMYEAASLAKNIPALAISYTVPNLYRGVDFLSISKD